MNGEMKFTPGPWHINRLIGETEIAASSPFRDIGCAFTNGSSDLDEGVANAAVMAAAPALFDSAKNAADFLRTYFGPVSHNDPSGWSDADAQDAYHKLQAAIDAALPSNT